MKLKKIVLSILAFTLIFSSVVMPNIVSAAQPVGVYGDATGDGIADIRDLVRLKKYLADNTTEIDLTAVDLNGDSNVDSQDLVCFRKLLLGIFVGGTGWPADWSEALSQLD